MPEPIKPIVGKKNMTEQDKARIAAMKRNWEQRRKVGENLGKIKNKIAVYSGKGGVGKTTIAVNLAVLLAQRGHSVGLLDADIDCPNVIRMLHMHSGPSSDDDGKIIPAEKHGVKVMSMGFFQKNELEAIIWRGPMIHNAINQFLELTSWGDLDYLVVDLPPGTSDAPLTIMQVLKLDGFVVVTTPQDLSFVDAVRSINMIRKMNVNILGVVENMSGEIFGQGAGEAISDRLGIKFLGRFELHRAFSDMSAPVVLRDEGIRKQFGEVLDGALSELSPAESGASVPSS